MDEDKARVSFECVSCQAKAELAADLKHTAECKNKIGLPKKVCDRSGQAPHASDTKK